MGELESVTARREPPLAVGVDLGGTKVEAALVDTDGRIVAAQRRLTNAGQGAEKVVSDIVSSVRGCLRVASEEVGGLGIGVAGQVEPASGVVRFAPNLGWRDVRLGDLLREALGLPVSVINDVQAATLGEWRHGAGRGADNLVCVFVGTGVGGGVVAGGQLLGGATGAAGELGHTTIVVDGRRCHCPNHGCLEAYVGGWAIGERARDGVRAEPRRRSRLVDIAGSMDRITAAAVSEAYREGDPFARRLVEETAHFLAAGLVGIVNAFNPELVVLGGGVVDGTPDLAAMAEPHMRAHALPAAVERLRLAGAALGPNAVSIGAASHARTHFTESTA